MKFRRKPPGFTQPQREPDVLIEINTTPLIDVMLVLLIMVIISIPIETHAVKMDFPAMTQPTPKPPSVVSLMINEDGSMSWNGITVPNQASLDAQLTAAVAEPEPPEIHIRVDPAADYKYVAAVLAQSQRLGVAKIGFVQ